MVKKSLKIIKGNKIFWPLLAKNFGGWSIFLDGGVVIFGVSGGYLTPRDPPVSMYEWYLLPGYWSIGDSIAEKSN